MSALTSIALTVSEAGRRFVSDDDIGNIDCGNTLAEIMQVNADVGDPLSEDEVNALRALDVGCSACVGMLWFTRVPDDEKTGGAL